MSFEIVDDKKTKVSASVTQDNALISASYRLSLDAKRVVLLGISKVDAKKNLWQQGEYSVRIYAHEYRDYYGIDEKSVYRQMRKGIEDLYDANVIVTENGDVEGNSYRWISEQKYHLGEGWIEYWFTSKILLFLNSLYTTFTTYKLLNVGGLRSIYSIRIYELAIQFRSTGWRKMTIDGFRDALGIPDNQYRLFADLKKRVILPAVKEINAKTNLAMKFELGRKGRRFTHITLYFDEKAQHQLDLPEREPDDPKNNNFKSRYLIDNIPKFGSS